MNDGHTRLPLIREWQAKEAARQFKERQLESREWERKKRDADNSKPESEESLRNRIFNREEARRIFELEHVIHNPFSKRRLQNLQNRKLELVRFWRAAAETEYKIGRRLKDWELADAFDKLQGTPGQTTWQQARRLRLLVRELEAPGGIWSTR